MIHPLADCKNNSIPESTNIWQFCVVLPGAKDCNICSHCFIENDVVVGNRVTVKSGVQLWDGITLEDDTFVGANVTFTNDKYPRNKQPFELLSIVVKKSASIGAGSTILAGVIGEGAMIGAGSVVTKDVPAGELWMGNPARFVKK